MRRSMFCLLALALTGAAPAPDWTRTIFQTPSGATVMGNPKAKVRLVEYLSYTCPHCAQFTQQAAAPIQRDYVAKGLVAVELRNAVRDPYDLAAALLARCGGPSKVFGHTEAIMAYHDVWIANVELFEVRDAKRYEKLPLSGRLQAIARATGLTALLQARGLTVPQMNACLASKPMNMIVIAMTKEAFQTRKIPGTPHFLLNGTPGPYADTWAAMEPTLRTATGAQ